MALGGLPLLAGREQVAALTALLDEHAEQELEPSVRHANFGLDLGDGASQPARRRLSLCVDKNAPTAAAPTQPREAGSRAEFLEGDNDMARLLGWGSPFVDIIDNERVSPLLECLLNPGSEFPSPGFRLDHVYATLLRPGTQADPTLCGTSSWHSGPMMWPRSRHEYYGCDVRCATSTRLVVMPSHA